MQADLNLRWVHMSQGTLADIVAYPVDDYSEPSLQQQHFINADKRGYPHNIFLISPRKHMLWVLIRSSEAL